MPILERFLANYYRDSVALMQLSARLSSQKGIEQAAAVMATEANIKLLHDTGLLEHKVEPRPNDLLIVIRGEDEGLKKAMGEAEFLLNTTDRHEDGEVAQKPPRSIDMAMREAPASNLALISTPGVYAAGEAMKALRLGLHVMMFSDNVSREQEKMLKNYARDHDLMVMGPDCGTAIINGIPLGFANVVHRGEIGLVAASGTGLQQVTCLIERLGKGISQAIGTGSHDLSQDIGGITMLQGIEALAADPETKIIVLVSKPPAPDVAERVLAAAARCGKPIVANFLGSETKDVQRNNVHAARTLEDAAHMAVALVNGATPKACQKSIGKTLVQREASKFSKGQKYIRGLYSGGTFCYEALVLLRDEIGSVYSSTPLQAELVLRDAWSSFQHTVIDLGDDIFTRGRPHPMIDQGLRNERIVSEAADPEVAVILLDVVLGYGSNDDPTAEMVPVIRTAQAEATNNGRYVSFVAQICGTNGDPQELSLQEARLREAGVVLAQSNAQAVYQAAAIASAAGQKSTQQSSKGKVR
ncbi:MAG: acyl-CoA synthetase FdrA [Nitrospirales bacterium]|nr:acyl-CoA synthetase FdrA [Nitrospirales bacterium]